MKSTHTYYREAAVGALVIVVSVGMGLLLPWWLYGIFAVVLIVVRSYYVGPLLGALTHDIVYGNMSFGETEVAYLLSIGIALVASLVLVLKPRLLHTHELV